MAYSVEEQKRKSREYIATHPLPDCKAQMLESLVHMHIYVLDFTQYIPNTNTDANMQSKGIMALRQSEKRIRDFIDDLNSKVHDAKALAELTDKVWQEHRNINDLYQIFRPQKVQKTANHNSKPDLTDEQKIDKKNCQQTLSTMIGTLSSLTTQYESFQGKASAKRQNSVREFRKKIAAWKAECDILNKEINSGAVNSEKLIKKLQDLTYKIELAVEIEQKSLKGHFFSGGYTKLLDRTKNTVAELRDNNFQQTQNIGLRKR